jgi:hypothetical protein
VVTLLSHESLIVLACTGRNVQLRKFTQLRIPIRISRRSLPGLQIWIDEHLQRLRTQFFLAVLLLNGQPLTLIFNND